VLQLWPCFQEVQCEHIEPNKFLLCSANQPEHSDRADHLYQAADKHKKTNWSSSRTYDGNSVVPSLGKIAETFQSP